MGPKQVTLVIRGHVLIFEFIISTPLRQNGTLQICLVQSFLTFKTLLGDEAVHMKLRFG